MIFSSGVLSSVRSLWAGVRAGWGPDYSETPALRPF